MPHGFRLGRIRGIEIVADWSVLLIVLLVTVSLATGLLVAWHPQWTVALRVGVAVAAALLLLVSILLHELSHALVGRANGLQIERITLFVFGGLAHLKGEPRQWTTELKMALAGPVLSAVLGLAFLLLAAWLAPALPEWSAEDPLAAFQALGPVTTLSLWLGQVNLVLAAFNLVPGFPLDGGRVLRAILWGATGDLRRATRYAANAGRFFAALLMLAGFAMILGLQVPLFGRGPGAGLWLALIGWFLHNAAVMSYRQLLVRDVLEQVPVAQVMRREFSTVDDNTRVQELVDRHLLSGEQRAFPVMQGERFVGLVCLEDVRKLPRAEWPQRPVRDIMTPAAAVHSVTPGQNAAEAMLELGHGGVNQLPVMEQGRLRGLLSREDLIRLLTLYGDPPLAS